MQSRQCGKSEAREREAMKAWRNGERIIQFDNIDGELRMTRWIPQLQLATKHAPGSPNPPTHSETE